MHRSILVRLGNWQRASTLSELGIYGVFCRVGGQVILNEEVSSVFEGEVETQHEQLQ